MADRKRKKADPEAVDKLRREAARQRQAARIGELLRQLAAASDEEHRLVVMIDEVTSWAMGEPVPAALDTTWGLGAVMAALANELGKLKRSATDEEFSDLLADLQAGLPELWQAAHADPLEAALGPETDSPEE